MKIELCKGDITELEIEAIVNPANSNVTMGGGLAGFIRRKGGETIRKEARGMAPVRVGSAVMTTAGRLTARHVIHAPTMEKPAQRTTPDNARLAMEAALECAERNNIRELAVPGLGTGVGGVRHQDAARAMVSAARHFKARSIERLVFVAYDDGLYEALRKEIDSG